MSKFTFNSDGCKKGHYMSRDYRGFKEEVDVWYIESSDGVCCTDCGKEFTEIAGYSTRPFEGKLRCLDLHYEQTNCKNSPTRPKALST